MKVRPAVDPNTESPECEMKKQRKEEKRKKLVLPGRESKRGKTVEKRNWHYRERGKRIGIGKKDPERISMPLRVRSGGRGKRKLRKI